MKSITNHLKTHKHILFFVYQGSISKIMSTSFQIKRKPTSLLNFYAHLNNSSSSECPQPCDSTLIKIPFNMQSLCLLLSTADRH